MRCQLLSFLKHAPHCEDGGSQTLLAPSCADSRRKHSEALELVDHAAILIKDIDGPDPLASLAAVDPTHG